MVARHKHLTPRSRKRPLFREYAVPVPELRIQRLNDAPLRPEGRYVLYWMTAFRRTRYNFALQRAVEHANALGLPLVVFEALRAGYRWASVRHHTFVIQGMADNAEDCAKKDVTYLCHLERKHGDSRGLLQTLASEAAIVVGDAFPAFFLRRMLPATAAKLDCRLEAVDSNGLYPLRDTERVFTVAHSFRRHLQKHLPPHLNHFPHAHPLEALQHRETPLLPDCSAYHMVKREERDDIEALLANIEVDRSVAAVSYRGGPRAAHEVMERFFESGLPRYHSERNEPEADVSSGLSPYLHFGHISAHEVASRLFALENWTPAKLAERPNGKRDGWWNMSEPAEAFLDELITWREIGYNMCALRDDYDAYSSLPEWALQTLDEHRDDPRAYIYDLATFENAQTHDPLWNAAQNQLRKEGRIHNYLRMLWGKKVLEWSASPEEALEVLVELNNKYALDGRDPNSYSGIFWVFGRYDRAWGPERPIYGKVRYMTSKNTAKKVRVDDYIARYTAEGQEALDLS